MRAYNDALGGLVDEEVGLSGVRGIEVGDCVVCHQLGLQ